MSTEEIIRALRGLEVETGSLACLGCGYEHSCSVSGCAVIRAVADRLVELAAERGNPPLTLEQLKEMDGEPVWICDPDGSDGMWALVDLEYELCRTAKGGIAIFDTYGKTWLPYRRKPEEGTT